MIGLDFGILYTIGASIEGLPLSSTGFVIMPTLSTEALLKRYQSIHRFIDQKGHLFASDLVGTFEEVTVGDRKKLTLKVVAEDFFNAFYIKLTEKGLARKMDMSYRRSEIAALQDLPLSFKPIFYIDLAALAGTNPVDVSDIIGLAPPVIKIPVDQFESLIHQATGQELSATTEDDAMIQFDLNTALPGRYAITLKLPAPVTKQVYVDPVAYRNPPLAIAEITIPAGNVNLAEYTIEFKKAI